jgi:hypothetical protein
LNVSRPIGGKLSIALIHFPVYDKNRKIVTTAVTNLDLHDIARAARTYGLYRYYVVTPLDEQKELAIRIAAHWRNGWGAVYNPNRKEALDLITVSDKLQDAVEDLEKESGNKVKIVATGARGNLANISFRDMGKLLEDSDCSYLLIFGTGWGLADEILAKADYVLEPIRGAGEYNHLSVRSAAAIIMDRLTGYLWFDS